MTIYADIDDKRKSIILRFNYRPDYVHGVKRIPGARYLPNHQGSPAWRIPLSLKSGSLLREEFGGNVQYSPEIKRWAKEQKRNQQERMEASQSYDSELKVLPSIHPELSEWLRPYQRSGARFMSLGSCINADEPGLGKTVETIAAVYEAGRHNGCHLVLAPATSLACVWTAEIERWSPAADIWTGDTPKQRREAIKNFAQVPAKPCWLVINPQLLIGVHGQDSLKLVESIDWSTVIVDEYHLLGLSNPKSQTAQALKRIGRNARRYALSGTPTGGVPINLWGALNWVSPAEFSSRWNWAKQWLSVVDNGFGHDIGGVQIGRENQFYKAHSHLLLRRTKSEVIKELPPKQYITVPCGMTPKQTKQYNQMEAEAEVELGGDLVSAVSALAVMTRLKQFATAACTLDNDVIQPLPDSGKLAPLLDNLRIRLAAGESVVVASQFAKTCKMVSEYLAQNGIENQLIIGETKLAERASAREDFQAGEVRCVVISTKAGGVAITLDRADSIHILDETWNPDDQVQLEDRVHRISRVHQVTVYKYLARGTIEEAIAGTTRNKAQTANEILDMRRLLSLSKKLHR